MNFRHPFELGLAQFSPILLFELSRGILQTRPEAKFALVLQECDTLFSLTCSQDQWNPEIIRNMPSAFQWVVGKEGSAADLFPYLSLSQFPICLPVFFKQARYAHTHTRKDTHTHTTLCAPHICPGWLPRKGRLEGKWGKKHCRCRNNLPSLYCIFFLTVL